MMRVNKVYGSRKCCTKESKEADAFAIHIKEITLFVNKLGFWAEATEHQKVFPYHEK
jgi:hypothetical protein